MKVKIASLALVFAWVAGPAVTSVQGQTSFSMRLVADNDFAVFGGTASGVNDLLYQNNATWSQQISSLSTLNFMLPSGDTTFYVLGMGGGGQENISGTVNGVDMTAITVAMSSDLAPYLNGFASGGAVGAGTYNASLPDVETAFPHLSWGSPTVNSSDTVIQLASPNGAGFDFAANTAHLFSFPATEVGVQPTPEPSAMALAIMGALGLLRVLRRRR